MTLSPPSSLSGICLACIAQDHEECSLSFLNEEIDCCCGGTMTLREAHMIHMAAEQALAKSIFGDDMPDEGRGKRKQAAIEPPAAEKGDSGYIHQDAWPVGSADIGTYVDPESTGRKRQAKMYPITVGQVCEWAGLANAGGEFMPVGIMGCVNNPATDLHHGPDKNTLNNEKASWGVGNTENTHIICSECHNSTHAANDPFYPEYDRVEDQARPWLPIYPEGWEPTPTRKATTAELMAEEERRAADRSRRGRKTRGRNSRARGKVNTDLVASDDE